VLRLALSRHIIGRHRCLGPGVCSQERISAENRHTLALLFDDLDLRELMMVSIID